MEMEQTFRRFQVVEPSCFSCFFRIGRGAAGYSDVLYLPQGEDHKKRRTSAAFFRWGRVGCVQHSCNTPVSHDKAVTIRLMWPFVVLQRKECSSSVTGNWILKKNEGEEEALLWRLMGQRFCTRVLASPFFKACNYCNMSGEQHVFQKIDVNQSAWKSCPSLFFSWYGIFATPHVACRHYFPLEPQYPPVFPRSFSADRMTIPAGPAVLQK